MNFLIKVYETHKQELNNKIVSLTRTLPVYIEFRIGKVFLLIMKTYKTKLKLNNKQRTQLFRNAGVARFAYNLTLEIEENNYKLGKQFLSDCDVRKLITQRKQDDLAWLYNYDCDIVKQAVKDAVKAYKTFFKNKKGKPKFKSKRLSKSSFYVDGLKLKIQNGYVKIPKLSKISLYEKNYIPENVKIYQNPRITFDGIDWWISVGIKEDFIKPKLTDKVIGIDLGLKELATCSDGTVIRNITKDKSYKKLEKSIKQKQRQISRKYEQNKQGKKFIKTKNICKAEKRLQKKRIKEQNIKKDYFHKSTTALVRTKPQAIVLEDLNIKGMMKNKHLSHALQSTSINQFRQMLINKCKKYGIEVIEVDRWFPSSQICSECGNRKVDLNLSDRIYKCEHCENVIDRDLNAARNLAHYRQFDGKLSLWRAKPTKVA